jgi:hypothetical protein
VRPESVSLDALIANHPEEFVETEQYLSDGLEGALTTAFNVDPTSLNLIVALSESGAAAKIADGKVSVAFNGRLLPPEQDKDGVALQIEAKAFADAVQEWCSAEGLEVKIGELSTETPVVKFTVLVDCVTLPAAAEPEAPVEEEPADEPDIGSDKPEPAAEPEDTTEAPEEPAAEEESAEPEDSGDDSSVQDSIDDILKAD